MSSTDHGYFVPERPPIADLQSRDGVRALMDRALLHLREHGAVCIGCARPIDATADCSFILGRPVPRFACGDAACVERLWRLATDVSAPMLGLRAPGTG